jgi:prepilin-type N-terminal cleavage/methylation domain-containing protein
MKQRGFTVIELVLVMVILAAGGWLFFNEKARIDSVERDNARKVAINAMYYNLEEVYYAKNGYYPSSIDSKALRAMDPALFTDPYGTKMNEADADYRYEPVDCTTDGKCTGYTLRASLEREGDYIKKNRDH